MVFLRDILQFHSGITDFKPSPTRRDKIGVKIGEIHHPAVDNFRNPSPFFPFRPNPFNPASNNL